MESVRTGLTIGASVTAAFALLLAFRRQQLAERTQQATEYDAGEKRVTELYVKPPTSSAPTRARSASPAYMPSNVSPKTTPPTGAKVVRLVRRSTLSPSGRLDGLRLPDEETRSQQGPVSTRS
ncbi:hypothetical protein [Micromonospora sp. NPDC050276]|uniref:hypothetical protein n=1 Tax=Micromonospora sp. NPDC050276 TaxID=3364278 RepID=UPI00378D827F